MKASICIAVAFALSASTAVVQAEEVTRVPLSEAVAEFNEKYVPERMVRVAEPPLTEDEVVAAIRAIDRDLHRMDDWTYESFQRIAETGQFPSSARFTCLTNIATADFHIVTWRIYLDLKVTPGHEFRYPLRSRMVRSLPRSGMDLHKYHGDQIYKAGPLGQPLDDSPP